MRIMSALSTQDALILTIKQITKQSTGQIYFSQIRKIDESTQTNQSIKKF